MENKPKHNSSIEFKTEAYFSEMVLSFGASLLLIGLFVVFIKLIFGLLVLVVSVIILTTHYRLTIDFKTNVCHNYVWILGFKNGEKMKFETIEYIYINKNKVSQTVHFRMASSTVKRDVYDAYLKFSENDKIHLMRKNNREVMLKKLGPLTKALNIEIVDYSA